MKGMGDVDWTGHLEGDSGTGYVDWNTLSTDVGNPSRGWGNTGPIPSGNSFDWGALIGGIAKGGTSILSSRYSVPQLNPGQFIQGNGMTMYQGNPNASNGFLPNLGGNVGGSSSLMLLGIAGVVVFMMMKK